MKKFISFVMAAVLCVGMTTTVMAASPSTPAISGDGVVGTIKEVASDATNVTVKSFEEADYNESVKAELAKVADNSGVLAEVKKVVSNASEVEKVIKFDLHAVGAGTFKFAVDGINAGDNVLVLHFTNGAWKNMDAKVNADGKVEVFFDGNYSPVMIIKYAVASSTPAPTPAPVAPASPKTADVAMFGLCAAVALAGTVTAARKAKASK